jgi:iron complex transport system ATP-binding protein
MIRVRNVTLEVPGRILLRDLEFAIAAGEMVVIVGPNGVGKTTLLRAIAAMHPLVRGEIVLDGAAMDGLGARERAQRVALVSADEPPVEAMRVREVVATGRYPHHRWWQWNEDAQDERAISEALREVELESMRDRLFSTLSSGERRNAWIALALAQQTQVLLLDEPTTHLDVHVAQRILALLRNLARSGKTVLCTLHDLNEAAAYADRILVLGDGRLRVSGAPADVLADPALDEVYRTRLERLRLSDGSLRVFARPYPSGASSTSEY